jgi:hypothetical protein
MTWQTITDKPIARHVNGTHFQSSFIGLDDMLCRPKQYVPGRSADVSGHVIDKYFESSFLVLNDIL